MEQRADEDITLEEFQKFWEEKESKGYGLIEYLLQNLQERPSKCVKKKKKKEIESTVADTAYTDNRSYLYLH